ncbi:MAG: four helix bundle protein [bacterium]
MITRGFEQLEVYQLSENLADKVWEIVINWTPFARHSVGMQLVRAVDSIRANIAEGRGWRFKDNQRFVKIAQGSLNETKHWLRRAYKRQLLTEAQIEALKVIMDELASRLNAYLNSIGSPQHTKDQQLRTRYTELTKLMVRLYGEFA